MGGTLSPAAKKPYCDVMTIGYMFDSYYWN